ncbi:hypothetical protein [Nitrosomonas sp. Nm58]|jgi:hypothetical protein|nr:hypothetical protein [Nitrosomonas sp. Nm58]SDY21957.1 hypothetical protein SAMN05421754_10043 [Nitrosomonas sp. Nm58]
MEALAQVVLPFQVEATDESLTANAGLVLFGEFISINLVKTTAFRR